MKRALLLLTPLLFSSAIASAEDSVTLYGNYYKERSTRIYEPILRITKDLPKEIALDATILVDQITSASGAFTPEDRVISEFREEVRLALRKTFDNDLTPGILGRISYEPDYTSVSVGADLSMGFNRNLTTVTVYGQHQRDDVRRRGQALDESLATTLFGASLTQVVRQNFLVGASIETQILRGFQENVYRSETHPRRRNRYSGAGFASYHVKETRTTGRVAYRLYSDTWDLISHAADFEITQQLGLFVDASVRFRIYSQSDVYFTTPFQEFNTADPKLSRFASRTYGFSLRFTLAFLAETGLSRLSTSRIEPAYLYLDQDLSYGAAHIAQLGWYLPF